MGDLPSPDIEAIKAFLQLVATDGQIVLTSIPSAKTGTTTATFFDVGAAAGWAVRQNVEGVNVYWTSNTLREVAYRKPKEEDVEWLRLLQTDLDPRPPAMGLSQDELDEWNGAERRRMRQMLEEFRPRPTAVVDSGGGYQAIFQLADREYVGGDASRIDELKRYNIQLRDLLGGDNTQNLERLLRCAGTVNWPDKKKREKGRRPRLSSVVWDDGPIHLLTDFTQAPARLGRGTAGNSVALAKAQFVAIEDLPDTVGAFTRSLIIHGHDPSDPSHYNSTSEAMWRVAHDLVRAACTDEQIAGVLLNPEFGISEHPLRQPHPVDYMTRQIERAREDGEAAGQRVLDPTDPYRMAMRLREEMLPDAIHTNGDFLQWQGGAYRDVEDNTVKSMLWRELNASVVRAKTKEGFAFERLKPNPKRVMETFTAISALVHEPAGRTAPPVWLDGQGPPPLEIVPCSNGLLHVPTGELLPHTPRFFTRNALDIAYLPDAPEPVEWQAFINQVFPGPVAAELLQDFMGYLLLPDTSQQKILLMVGPPRSGKGVTQQIITQLVGQANTCNPKSGSLGSGNVGALQPLIGKTVAFLSDARFGGRSDKHAISETLLTVSGGDNVTIDRKFKEAWTGKLSARFVMLSNELPSLKDSSPALANRFVPLMFERSFLGREDPGLAGRIVKAELAGILNWALIGWRRLRERGQFILPAVSTEAIGQILDLGSPVANFLRECCDVDPNRKVEKDRLFGEYLSWCKRNEMHPTDKAHFGRDLMAASNNQIKSSRLAGGGDRFYVYVGVALLPTSEPY